MGGFRDPHVARANLAQRLPQQCSVFGPTHLGSTPLLAELCREHRAQLIGAHAVRSGRGQVNFATQRLGPQRLDPVEPRLESRLDCFALALDRLHGGPLASELQRVALQRDFEACHPVALGAEVRK